MAGQQQTAEAAEPKRKVLIIEDEKDIRDLVRYHLETEALPSLKRVTVK